MSIPNSARRITSDDFDRVSALERQLIMCELKGLTTKATLLRGTLHANEIKIQVEQNKG